MGSEDAFDSNLQLTDGTKTVDGKRYYRKSQVIAWVLLIVVMATVVGVLCGLLPQCVEIPPAEPSPIVGTEPPRTPPPEEPTTTKEGMTTEPAVPSTPGPCQGEWCELRLPESLQADHYILKLRPDLAAETYVGDVTIEITVTENIKYPRVHYKTLDITNPVVRRKDGTVLPISSTFYYEPNEFYVIEMEDELTPGEYEIDLHFTGSLVGKIVGFYKSIYTNAAGEERWLATSKFQPTDARRAFPCLDEPDFKASFTTTLEHNMDSTVYNALSNMPVDTVGPTDDGWGTKTTFQKSVKMSTYLAIFIVCDFDYTEGEINGGKPFRVYAPPDKVSQTEYALRVGINITNFYVEYFDLDYPLPKLDMIAIPDFVSGAMEHWGLITYRERYLLYDPNESSEGNKERINVIVAHELAHMWFGNIVTMKWWDDLWLNEGFASYLEYLGANEAEPTWNMLDQFVTGEIYYVFELDQIVSSHPIVVEVNNPDEINQIFDAISYSKGASVIRMMNFIIGEDNFRAGLSIFLKRFQFENAVSQDLWDALQEASGVDVGEIMDTWTLQMGFPVVNLTRNGDKVIAEQEWFLVDPMANKTADEYGSPYDYNWDIFFDYYYQSDTTTNLARMQLRSISFDWVGSPTDWYIANVGQTGYYRVNYDTETWNSLVDQLLTDHTVFSASDRSGLIDDAFNLARAEDIDYTVALNLTKYLSNEEEYVPWDAAFGNIFWMGEMLRFRPCYGLFRRYIEAQSRPLFDVLGWNDITEHTDIFLQSEIIDLSCGHGNADCLDQGVELFRTFVDGNSLRPDLRSNGYQYGMQEEGDQDNWDYLWEQYQTTQSASEKSRLQFALARTREVWLLSRYIEYTEDESKIREQDYFSVMTYIADNPVGNPLVWDYVRDNWQKLVDRFGLGNRYLGRLVPSITEYYTTELKQQQMIDFFTEYPDAGAGETPRKQALERVQTNINWVARNEKIIEAWLKENTMNMV